MATVIISGGSSGIGLATVKRFLQADYHVINLDIQALNLHAEKFTTITCDVSSVAALDAAMTKVLSLVDSVDALVCSAGVHFSATLLQSCESDFDRMVNTNIKSCFFLTKAVLPSMIKAQKGAIIYVGSDQSLIAKKNSALYSMTKSALTGLTKSTALDYASYNIRANLVAAGTVDTPLMQTILQRVAVKNHCDIAEVIQEEALEFPLKRIAQGSEIAELIYFLASYQALFMTGALIPIDGGYTAQ